MNENDQPTTTTDWQARAEKVEAELERLKAACAELYEALDDLRIGVDLAVDEGHTGPFPIPGCVARMAQANKALADARAKGLTP